MSSTTSDASAGSADPGGSRLNGFLAGIRVVDLSRYLPGPLATLLLADLGADVVKIEGPDGDGIGAIGPRLDGDRGAYYEAITAGKSVIALDLKSPAGRDRLLALLDGADVLVESFRPGVMARLGLAPALLRERNPGLVCISLSGYGRTGPLRDAAGHDNNYLGRAGMLAGNGPSPDVPTLVQPPVADCVGSMFALSAVLGALLARHRDGRGCDIDLALADVVMPLQTFQLADLAVTGRSQRRGGEWLNGGRACYRIYRTQDGREMTLGAIEPKFWHAFCEGAGRPDWIDRQDEPQPQRALIDEVTAFFAGSTAAALTARFETIDCCLAPVLSLSEAMGSEQVRQRGLVPRDPATGLWQALFPAIVDGQAPRPRRPVVRLDGDR